MDADTGAQSGTDSSATQSGGAGNSGDNNASAGDTASTGTQSGTQGQQNASTEDTVSRVDYETIQNRMKAADQRAAKFEQELTALRNKDLPEAEKLKAEHEAATQKVNQLTDTNRKLLLENAFLKDNTHEWRNPAAAMKLLDMSSVTIDDDGHVVGLKDALKKLANAEPYLLKEKAASEGSSSGGGTGSAGATSTGSAGVPPMNGKPDSAANATKGLEKRLPALMTRRRP
jgi:hypothetical protein